MSVTVIIAVGVNSDGRREVLDREIGNSEAEPVWTAFVRKLTRRGLRGVKLVVSDSAQYRREGDIDPRGRIGAEHQHAPILRMLAKKICG